MIKEGRKAPDFTLEDASGKRVSLSDFGGKEVIVYFYPRDDTPGCTKEACGFRDLWADVRRAGMIVLGISADSPGSHAKFAAKYRLPFPLLSDPDRKVMEAWGAYGEKLLYGKKTTGVIRSTVWIGPDGVVRKHWARVADAAKHPAQASRPSHRQNPFEGGNLDDFRRRHARRHPAHVHEYARRPRAIHHARARGTITAVEGNVLSVKTRDGKDLEVELTEKATVAAVQAVKLSDIKPGDAVGSANRAGPGGTLTALEVHVFPAGMPIPNEGHRPWDLEPGSMMTNARVTAVVQATNGRELTLTYKDGAQKIVVPEGVPVVTAVAADRSALKPGEHVFFAADVSADGKVTASGRIQVSRDGVRPPQ